jgi:hypothetical protein
VEIAPSYQILPMFLETIEVTKWLNFLDGNAAGDMTFTPFNIFISLIKLT